MDPMHEKASVMCDVRLQSQRLFRALSFTTLLLFSHVARAEEPYRLNVGDVLELGVAGMPELGQKIQIGFDGELMVPLVGPINAAGLTLRQIRDDVASMLASKTIHQRGADGQTSLVAIDPTTVSFQIAEYRPVYVQGDVLKPGEQPFRPGMTVRQALAVAGGFDLLGGRFQHISQQSDLQGGPGSLWIEYAQQQAMITRLRAVLSETQEADLSQGLQNVPVAHEVMNEIVRVENEQLSNAIARQDSTKKGAERGIRHIEQRLLVLSEQLEKEQEGIEVDEAEFAKMKDLRKRNVVTTSQMLESRRAMLISATRALQTSAQMSQLQREKDDLQRVPDTFRSEVREKALAELQESQVKLASLRARIAAYTGQSQTTPADASNRTSVKLILFRDPNNTNGIDTAQDTRLMPGDVIEVQLPEFSFQSQPASQELQQN